MIAEQEALGGSVVWTHADPVTGSFQRVFKSGAAIDSIRDRQEFEPLGQSVRTTAPPVFDPPPPNPAPVINDSLFPEWQCQLPKQLMPSHCGLKMLADEKAYFGKWGEDKEKGNVSKLSDSPLPERYSGGVDRMTYALATATAKPDKKKKTNKFENVLATVQSLPTTDNTVPGFIDASVSGDDCLPGKPCPQPRPTPTPQGTGGPLGKGQTTHMTGEESVLERIKDAYLFAANSEECTKAFKAIGATPVGEQLSTVTIATENVMTNEKYDSFWSAGGSFAAEVRSALANNPKTNDLSMRGFIGITNRAISGQDEHFAVIVIHSFIHSSGIRAQNNQSTADFIMSQNIQDLKHLGQDYKDIIFHCTRMREARGIGQ